MKADDYQDIENVRNIAISQLAEVCAAMGLSWSAQDNQFVIHLPTIQLTSNHQLIPKSTRRKTFDISSWGDKGIDETLPTDMQMPNYGEILEEGEPPKGDKDAEK